MTGNCLAFKSFSGAEPGRSWPLGRWRRSWLLACPLLLLAVPVAAQSRVNRDFQRATRWMKEGDFQQAGELLESVVRRDPEHLAARNNLAACLIRQRRFKQAELQLLEVLRRDPGRPNARLNLGNADQGLGETVEALRETERAHELYGRNYAGGDQIAAAFFNRGWLHDELQRYEEAEQLYRQALARRPNYGRAWIALGVTLARQRKVDEAEDAFRRGERLGRDKLDDPLVALATKNLEVLERMKADLAPELAAGEDAADDSTSDVSDGSSTNPPGRSPQPDPSTTASNSTPTGSEGPAGGDGTTDAGLDDFARAGLFGTLGLTHQYRGACIFGFLAAFAVGQMAVSGWMVQRYGKPLLDKEKFNLVLACLLFGGSLFFLAWGYEHWGWWISAAVVSLLIGVARC